jgi:hypothetical protein
MVEGPDEKEHSSAETRREALRMDLQAGLDQLNSGEFVTPTAEEVKSRVEERLGQGA